MRASSPPANRSAGVRACSPSSRSTRFATSSASAPWRYPATDPAKVIAVANFKGGVAKTSVAVHLAQYAARKGLRTLLVDLDAQGSATTTFGLRPDADVESSQTLSPWLHRKDLADPDEWTGTLATAVQRTYWPGLDLIARRKA